jgi:large subunit ribosomal protein L9
MKVILLEDIKTLGQAGTQVVVADGFARNFLIPQKQALIATEANQRVFDNEKKALAKKREKERLESQELATKLEGLSLTISRLAGEDDKLFGSVTNGDVADALAKEGHKVDKRDILLPDPIRALGIVEVPLQLHPQVTAKLKVWVVKQETAA